jgi:hypothetical protein
MTKALEVMVISKKQAFTTPGDKASWLSETYETLKCMASLVVKNKCRTRPPKWVDAICVPEPEQADHYEEGEEEEDCECDAEEDEEEEDDNDDGDSDDDKKYQKAASKKFGQGETKAAFVKKKPAVGKAVGKQKATRKPSAAASAPMPMADKTKHRDAADSSGVQYTYGYNDDKGLAWRKARGAPKSVPPEMAVSMQIPVRALDTDPVHAVFSDGSVVPVAQRTVAQHRGTAPSAPEVKKKGKGNKGKPAVKVNYWKEGPDDNFVEVKIRDNNYRNKPKQRLVCLVDARAQVMQLNCKYWYDPSLVDDFEKQKAQSELAAFTWMKRLGVQYLAGNITKEQVLEHKKQFIDSYDARTEGAHAKPKGEARAKSQPARSPTDGHDAPAATEELVPKSTATGTAEATQAKPQADAAAPGSKPDIALTTGLPPTTPTEKVNARSASPNNASKPVEKKSRIAPPSDSSDD